MKYRLIEAEKAEHRISRLCKVLGVTRQGFYAWRRRGPSLRSIGDAELARLIVTIDRRKSTADGTTSGLMLAAVSWNARLSNSLRPSAERTSFSYSAPRPVGPLVPDAAYSRIFRVTA
jgi:hypothetical protein